MGEGTSSESAGFPRVSNRLYWIFGHSSSLRELRSILFVLIGQEDSNNLLNRKLLKS